MFILSYKTACMSSRKPTDMPGNRHEFQLDRLILFSDAVFAIAITLLIIEIKVPDSVQHATSGLQVWKALGSISLKLMGFVFSFLLIGGYWMAHHRLFRYVVHYNSRLIWLNLFLLMFVVFFPFTTALAFETIPGDTDTPFIVYSFNHICIGLLFLLLWWYIAQPAHKLSDGLTNKKYMQYNYWRSFSIIIIFSITIVLCFVKPVAARLFTVASAFVIPILNRIYGFKG